MTTLEEQVAELEGKVATLEEMVATVRAAHADVSRRWHAAELDRDAAIRRADKAQAEAEEWRENSHDWHGKWYKLAEQRDALLAQRGENA